MPSWPMTRMRPSTRRASPAAPDLGVVADMFWRQEGVLRADHPLAFAACGPRAAIILADPLPLPPHIPESPVGRVHDLDGQVLLLGVGHDANSTLHLAELVAGVPYRVPKYCTVLVDGRPTRVAYRENDHCCERFSLADTWLSAIGCSRWARSATRRSGSRGRATSSRSRARVGARSARLPASRSGLRRMRRRAPKRPRLIATRALFWRRRSWPATRSGCHRPAFARPAPASGRSRPCASSPRRGIPDP